MSAWATEWSIGESIAARPVEPVLAVVGANDAMAVWLAMLCESLKMEISLTPDAAALACALESTRPVAVLCGDLGEAGRGVSRVLRLVSCYDRSVPVLVMTADDPETLGSIDAATELWPVDHLERSSLPVPVSVVLDFLARAGQSNGLLRIMPI
jgi:hypothetical protein